MTLRCDQGRQLSAIIVVLVVLVVARPASSQAVTINAADHYGSMLHPPAARPSFEVAVIRQSAPNSEMRFSGIGIHSNVMDIRGSSMKEMIEFAYAVPDDKQFFGGPSWVRTEKFDITAKPSEAEAAALKKLSPTNLRVQMRLMLQSLLEQRFKLQVGFAMKDLPLYALVVTKGGFKCTRVAPDNTAAFDALGPPPPPPAVAPGHEPGREQEMHWAVHSFPLPLITAWISQQPELGGRTMVDRTGLNGGFDCELSWAPEDTNLTGPSFFTAIREQMGLKLLPERGPVETLVLREIEQPSAN